MVVLTVALEFVIVRRWGKKHKMNEQEKERDTLCALVTNVEVYMQCKQHLRGNEGIVMHCNVHKPPDRFKIQLTSCNPVEQFTNQSKV